jgi:hypothetical protein
MSHNTCFSLQNVEPFTIEDLGPAWPVMQEKSRIIFLTALEWREAFWSAAALRRFGVVDED